MRGRERVELARKRAVAARGEVGVDPRLQRGQPRFLEPRRLSLRERLEGEVGKCLPAPELERAVRVTVGDQAREAVDVELVRVDADDVARRPGDDPVGADRPAERMHVHLERARRARGWLPRPRSRRSGGRSRRRRSRRAGAARAGHAAASRRAGSTHRRLRSPPSARAAGIPRPHSSLSRPSADRKRLGRRCLRPVLTTSEGGAR